MRNISDKTVQRKHTGYIK